MTAARAHPPHKKPVSSARAVVSGCETAIDDAVAEAAAAEAAAAEAEEAAGREALQEAVRRGGVDASFRAAVQQVRALALRLLHTVPCGGGPSGADALLSAVSGALLAAVDSADKTFPRWRLPYTADSRLSLIHI